VLVTLAALIIVQSVADNSLSDAPPCFLRAAYFFGLYTANPGLEKSCEYHRKENYALE
jgi:hypothetical protein